MTLLINMTSAIIGTVRSMFYHFLCSNKWHRFFCTLQNCTSLNVYIHIVSGLASKWPCLGLEDAVFEHIAD